ncbi:MAG: DUF3592 domain-containing protein [Alcanivorax sp.]
MFDLVFNAMSAWNSIGLIIMALVFLLIGGGMTGYELYWRLKAKRIKGRIAELRFKKGSKSTSRSSSSRSSGNYTYNDKGGTQKSGGVAIFFFIIFPLIFSSIGAYMGYSYISLTKTGEYADATVIRNDSSYDSDSGTTYKAVLSFVDRNGKHWEVKDSISYGGSPSFKTGSKVGVYYRADNPKKFVIDDFWHNMVISIAFMAFGFVFISIVCFAFFFKGNVGGKTDNKVSGGKPKKESFMNDMYYAVYEYRTPSGETMQQVSGSGSSNLLGKLPGKKITLMVFPENPDKVRRPSNALLIFGLIFLLPGLFIANVAVTTFEFSFMTVAIILAIIGFITFKIKGVMSGIPAGELKKGWEEFKKEGVTITSSGGGENAKALDQADIAKRVKYHARNTMISGYIMLVIALCLSGGAYYTGLDMVKMTQNGLSAQGEVVGIESRRSDDGYTYHSVISFTDMSGVRVKFRDSVGSSHALHKRGDMIDVLYLEEDPQDAIVDRGIYNWGLSGGLAIAAILLLWLGVHSLAIARIHGGPGYRSRV